jgi:hypothetical protein
VNPLSNVAASVDETPSTLANNLDSLFGLSGKIVIDSPLSVVAPLDR